MVVGAPPFMAENEMKLVEMMKTKELRIPTDSLMDPHLRCGLRWRFTSSGVVGCVMSSPVPLHRNLLLRMITKTPQSRITLNEVRSSIPR